MALPSSGAISTNDIVQEFAFASGTVMELRVQKPASTTQVWIDGAWRNCNMCSPSIPDHTAPYILADDFYGYDHSAYGFLSVSINGNSNVLNGVQESYTSSVSGYNLTGIIYTWTISGGNIDSGQGTSSVLVTWTNAASGSLTLTISGACDGVNKAHTLNTTLACTAPHSASISGTAAIYVPNNPYSYSLTYSGSNATSIVWNVGAYGVIVSGQGSNAVSINWNFNDPYSSQSSTVSCTVTNSCGSITTNTITVNPSVYDNVVKSGSFTKNDCSEGGWGSSVTYTIPAGTYKAYNQTDADNAAQNDVNVNGQSYANTNGFCTWGNDAIETYYTRNNCAVNETGSNVYVSIAANTYTSTTSKAAANSAAVSAAQSYANTNGTCTPNCAELTINSLPLNVGFINWAPTYIQLQPNVNNPSSFHSISYEWFNSGIGPQTNTSTMNVGFTASFYGSYKAINVTITSCGGTYSNYGGESNTVKVLDAAQTGVVHTTDNGIGVARNFQSTIYGDYTPFTVSYSWSVLFTDPGLTVNLWNTTSATATGNFSGGAGTYYYGLTLIITINGQSKTINKNYSVQITT